jgi:phosphoribosylanthranilate isomerase
VKIKICGLFREQDIDYVNDARPDYAGFVFAESKRQVSHVFAARLRRRLSGEIISVGVFVNAPVKDIVTLYRENIIAVAQLHGTEDGEYIARLKEESAADGGKPVEVIKTIKSAELEKDASITSRADYYLIDSGAGSGKTFNWELLDSAKINALISTKPWFLAGGIDPGNIEQAMAFNPFALDVSSGAETDGVKDREKIERLTALARKGMLI